jgi:glyoxylate/hydroxypyruvate reductase A
VGDAWPHLPNLKLVQKLGAGVEGILGDPRLPDHVRVARLAPDIQAVEIAEYCLAVVLAFQRNLPLHHRNALTKQWRPVAPRKTRATTIAVLGLGHIGRRVAALPASLGFTVKGWSRRPKSLDGIACFSGADGLSEVVADSDYIVAVLPSTPQTRDLFDRSVFAMAKPGAVFVNVGRGDQVVERDLLNALDGGGLGAAVLDVFRQEPLPADSPLWAHDKVTVTPHVAGWHLDEGFADVARNYRRLTAGEPLLHEVDRQAGY